MLYFLGGEKSDTLKTTENFLADNSSFVIVKRLRTEWYRIQVKQLPITDGEEQDNTVFRSLFTLPERDS